MKKAPVLIISAIVLIFGTTYFIFKNKVSEAILEVNKLEANRVALFQEFRKVAESTFVVEHPGNSHLFSDYYSEDIALYDRDTIISFFVYSKTLKIQDFQSQYLACLNQRCEAIIQNKIEEEKLNNRLAAVNKRYGELAKDWFSKLGQSKFMKSRDDLGCQEFFNENRSVTFNESALEEFEAFLHEYVTNQKNCEASSKKSISKYEQSLNRANSKLNSEGKRILSGKIEYNSPLKGEPQNFSYNGNIIGLLSYSISQQKYDESELSSSVNEAFAEQYKNNSLHNGAKPYAYCFGSSNSCSGYGCSRVDVSSGGSDVLVLIKNENEKVVRHGYIKSGGSYQFNIPNGSYQVFFYSGKGWNPNKFMKNTYCGELNGGFVASESITKDSRTYISNQILTYELIMQQNGNFSTQSSSKNEAF